jgi:hypothetical protein
MRRSHTGYMWDGQVPHRRVRGLGAPRRRRGLRADDRRGPGELVRQAAGLCVHSETCGLAPALEHTGDLYSCDHFVKPGYKLGNIRDTHDRPDPVAAADRVWPGQAGHPPEVLPPVRRALRLPRRMLEGPVRYHPRPIASPACTICAQLQGVLQPHPPGHGGDVLATAGRPGTSTDHDGYAKEDAKRGRNEACTCGSAASGSTAAAPHPAGGGRRAT